MKKYGKIIEGFGGEKKKKKFFKKRNASGTVATIIHVIKFAVI